MLAAASRHDFHGHTLALALAASGALNIAFTTGIIARRADGCTA